MGHSGVSVSDEAHAAAAPRMRRAGSPCRGAGLTSVRCVTHVSGAGVHSPLRVSTHDRARRSPVRINPVTIGERRANPCFCPECLFNLYINFQICGTGFAHLVLASGTYLVALRLRVYSWFSDSFCCLKLENDIIYQENSFRFTVLPFPFHMRVVYSLSMRFTVNAVRCWANDWKPDSRHRAGQPGDALRTVACRGKARNADNPPSSPGGCRRPRVECCTAEFR